MKSGFFMPSDMSKQGKIAQHRHPSGSWWLTTEAGLKALFVKDVNDDEQRKEVMELAGLDEGKGVLNLMCPPCTNCDPPSAGGEH